MIKLYVEDAAHDAVLKILSKPSAEIQISKGRGRVITLTFEMKDFIGFIDEDKSMDSRLQNVNWERTDDFKHCLKEGKLFIKFEKYVEEWLYRIAKECKVDRAKHGLSEDPKEWHLNQKIVSKNKNARDFLQEILDAKDSPLKLLKKVIDQPNTK